MAIKRRLNKAKEQLSDIQWDFLCDKPMPENDFEAFILKYDVRKTNEQLWEQHRDVILAEHTKAAPGTRPALFWEYDAPRSPIGTYPGAWYDGRLPEPRQRLGGTGTPAYECRAVKPSFSYGIAEIWVGIDSDDPPIFESEAAYLKRNNLLMPGEEKHSDFETEFVPKGWDWWP
jgi:hypothetical protein